MKNTYYLILLITICFIQLGKAQELTMFAGTFGFSYYEDSNKLNKTEFESILKSNKTAYQYWKKANNYNKISLAAYTAGIGMGLLAVVNLNEPINRNIFLSGFIVSMATSVSFSITKWNLKKQAILNYNDHIDDISMRIGTTSNGVGIAFVF